MKNNFDDFLLDGSSDDLDALHASEERDLYRRGGLKKKIKAAAKKVKGALTKKKAKTPKYSNADVNHLVKAKGDSKATVKPKAKSLTAKQKFDKNKASSIKKAEVESTKSRAKPVQVAKTIKKVKTKRNTGNTYKATWDANKGKVQGKYKTYKEFETAAKAWNAKNDKPKAKAKPKAKPKVEVKASSPNETRKKKLLSENAWDKIPTGSKL